MKQLSEHSNPNNYRIHYFYQMSKIIVYLLRKKGISNDVSYLKLADIHNPLLMSTFDTPEKDVSHPEGYFITRKVYTSYVNSSSPYMYI